MTELSSTLQLCLDRLRDGDPAALNDLFRHSQERLRALTRQMLAGFPRVHDWEDTSDVYSGAMVRLHAALNDPAVRQRVQAPRDLLRLSATLIRRELIDLARRLRSRKLAAPGQDDTQPDVAGPPADDPFRIAAWQELHRRIDEELTDDERELWDVRYYQGLTEPEASAILGIPERTLRRHWMLLREKLAESFGDDWRLDDD